MKIYNTTILFTGDMTDDEERDVLKKYGKRIDSDILKVAHHGSDTSSTKEFINLVSPKYSIISVSKNNSYGLPKKEIVDRLLGLSKVYMTKDCGNIDIYVSKEGVVVSPYIN